MNQNINSELLNVPTRAMASLLSELAPDKFSKLKEQYSAQHEIFEIEFTLGETYPSETTGIDSERIAALKSLVEETLAVSGQSILVIQSSLMARIITSRRARLGGSIVATISSASVVASITVSVPLVASVVSVFALLGSIAMLVGEHLEQPVIGGDKSLHELLSQMVASESSLSEVNLRLLTEDLSTQSTLVDIAKSVNKISATIKEISVFSGIALIT